jgi:hypothetical protein
VEAALEKFVATVKFEFEKDSLDSVGARMRTLGRIARDAGFELKQGKVEPLAEHEDGSDDDMPGWTRYAP